MGSAFTTKRLLVAATMVTLLVSLTLTGFMVRPRAVMASPTAVEAPGIVFAPTVVFRGQHVRACASKVLASSGFVTIAPQMGACLDSDGSDLLKTASAAAFGVAVRTGAREAA